MINMMNINPNEDLSRSIEDSFNEICSILKALGNQKRFKIVLSLLQGLQAFGTLLKVTELQRTALSNHLTQLIDANLIEKVDYGVYKISGDGLEFLKALKKAYYESPTRLLTQFEKIQSRKISDPFLHRFRV